jgi:hypothetical protein
MTINQSNSYRKQTRRFGTVLFCLCLFFFGLIPYGGIRSSDSEIVFRVAESLANRGVFYVEHDLENWHSFGVASGKSQRLYSIFGPLESVLLAPIVKAGELVNETGWYKSIVPMLPLSHFTEGGFFDYVADKTTSKPEPHALRMFCSFFNVLVTSFGVFVFWRILLLLTKSIPASFLVSIIYGVGTHAWAYAGTFFSEPLATLLVLLSFYYLVSADQAESTEGGERVLRPVALSGIWMGLAITAHITAALYTPFFAFYVFWRDFKYRPAIYARLERVVVFSFSVFFFLFLLGLYNYFRFGSFFETGRTVSEMSGNTFGYGAFVSPFRGLYGLIFGAGKGVLFFMPVLVLSSLLSKSFLRENRMLFWMVASAVIFRVLFIAARSDWHGGFCLGPRYLVMAIPFFLIPLAFWLKTHEQTGFARAFGAISLVGFVASVEQLYFCLAEVITFLHVWKFREMDSGFSPFENDILYLDWKYSPLFSPSSMKIAPFLLRWTHLPLSELMTFGAILLLIFFAIVYLLILKMPRSLPEMAK